MQVGYFSLQSAQSTFPDDFIKKLLKKDCRIVFSVKFGINKHPFLCRSDEKKFENIILKKYFRKKIEIFDIENFGNFQNPENPKNTM